MVFCVFFSYTWFFSFFGVSPFVNVSIDGCMYFLGGKKVFFPMWETTFSPNLEKRGDFQNFGNFVHFIWEKKLLDNFFDNLNEIFFFLSGNENISRWKSFDWDFFLRMLHTWKNFGENGNALDNLWHFFHGFKKLTTILSRSINLKKI